MNGERRSWPGASLIGRLLGVMAQLLGQESLLSPRAVVHSQPAAVRAGSSPDGRMKIVERTPAGDVYRL